MTVPSIDDQADDLVDLDVDELVDNALGYMADRFPGWVPREGNTEVVLIEALARMVAEDLYAINELRPGLLESLLGLYGLERDPGLPPSGQAAFTIYPSTDPTLIPAGTALAVADTNTGDPLFLATDSDLTIAPGQTTGLVSVSSADPTADTNGVPTGTALLLVDALVSVSSVALTAPLSGGRDPEDQAGFLGRGTSLLSRLTSTLVRPADIDAWCDDQQVAARHLVIDLYNPDTPYVAPGAAGGHVTVAVAGPAGTTVTADRRTVIAAALREKMHAGLSVHVTGANVTTVNVTTTVLRFAGFADADVIAAVQSAVAGYLNADEWGWAVPVRTNELISRIDQAAGVDAVLTVTPAADVTLSGRAPLARLGTCTVTVVAP